jgi:O-antigen/teichoic acid export membrane protein
MKQQLKAVMKSPLLSGSFVMFGGSMFANVVNQIYHIVMGKLLPIEGYGTLAAIFSLLYIISIVPLSTSIAIVKFISTAKSESEIAQVYLGVKRFIQVVAIAGCLILVVLSPLIANFLHIEEVVAVALAGPVFYFSLTTLVNQAASQGTLKFLGVVTPGIVASITKLLFGALFVLIGWYVTGALWGVVISMVLGYLVSTLFVREIHKVKRTHFNLEPFLKFSAPALLQALAFTSIFTVDLILVKHFLTPSEAGAYAALSLLGKIIFFASSPVTSVMFPIVAGKRARGERIKNIFILAFVANIAISLGVVIMYALFPELIITILYKNDYLWAAGDLVWMGAFIAMYTATHLLVNFALSIGMTRAGVFPAIAAIIQILAILMFHSNILEVIQVSLVITFVLFLSVCMYLSLQFKKS